ncbi:MAG: amidohydrolase family protein [Candidatus Aminicenantes bacterium]
MKENIKGTLTPGKLAGLAILSKDIMSVPEQEILRTEVLMTMVGGRIVYPE